MQSPTLTALSLCFSIAIGACGGAAPNDKSADKTAAKAGETPGKDAEKPAAPKPEEKPAEPERLARSPKDIITAPDVVFVFSFSNSEAGEKAQESCAKKSKDNTKKQNECVAKERKKIVNDMLSVSKDKSGKWWWTVARMQGTKLTALHKVEIEFGEEKADTITLKPTGRDKGKKPWANPPNQIKLSVPNEFSVVVDDPTYGKMVYEAKIGIAGAGGG